MLSDSNDPIAAARRASEKAAREDREALRAGGTQPFQAVRKISRQIDELRELVLRLPENDGRQVDVEGFTIPQSETWRTLATATIPRPSGKTAVVVSVTASVAALTLATEWGAAAYETRIVINGTASKTQVAVMEGPGVQYQRGSAYPSFVRRLTGLAGSVTVQLQARTLGVAYDAFTDGNEATLSVTAGFSAI